MLAKARSYSRTLSTSITKLHRVSAHQFCPVDLGSLGFKSKQENSFKKLKFIPQLFKT